jgi:hypothetical protein
VDNPQRQAAARLPTVQIAGPSLSKINSEQGEPCRQRH